MGNFITFPNGLKVSNDGREIFLPDGEAIFTDVYGKRITKAKYLEKCNWLRYFDYIGEQERDIISYWCDACSLMGLYEYEVVGCAQSALERVTYNYSIANMEPSIKNNKIFYREGEKVCTNLTYIQWLQQAQNFAKEYNSDLAVFDELILYYVYRIAMRYWTLDEVCHRRFGDKYLTHLTGEVIIGGARDGIGNTQKLIKSNNGTPMLYGNSLSCIAINSQIRDDEPLPNAVGVIVVKNLVA